MLEKGTNQSQKSKPVVLPAIAFEACAGNSAGLLAGYDKESGITSLRLDRESDWALGLNIAGSVIVDCDPHGYICNIDLLVPKRLWASSDHLRKSRIAPREMFRAKLPDARKSSPTFDLLVQVQKDSQDHVTVLWKQTEESIRRVCVGERVDLIVAGALWAGFSFSLR